MTTEVRGKAFLLDRGVTSALEVGADPLEKIAVALDRLFGTSPAAFETHELDELPGPSDEPGRAAEGRELHERLRLSLAKLSPQQAETFYLRYMEELDYGEIAEALGIDVNQVGVVLHRARARLREILAPVARAHRE